MRLTNNEMNLNTIHQQVRKKLDNLGFSHPLPLGAIQIVSAILDDLITTSESLKLAREENAGLLEEKVAWELGVEPYKCDNSRLLAESNALHLDLLKQREKYELKLTELRRKIRNLETDKRYLLDKSSEIQNKYKELQLRLSNNKGSSIMSKKPFVSTVKPGIHFPQSRSGKDQNACKCSCTHMKCDIIYDIEKLQNENKAQTDLLETYKKQLESNNREIERLSALFSGGRSAGALGKDCCYKNVSQLAKDVEVLQYEKIYLQKKLNDALESQQEISRKAMGLENKNKQLQQELRAIENVALNVESQANLNIMAKNKLNTELKCKLENSLTRIEELEKGSDEKVMLYKKVDELKDREKEFVTELDKIRNKYMKMKAKVREADKLLNMKKSSGDYEDIKAQKDYFEKEYSKMLDKLSKSSNEDIDKMRYHLKEKEGIICDLKREISSMKISTKYRYSDTGHSHNNQAVQNTIQRLERERDTLAKNVEKLEIENMSLQSKLKIIEDSQIQEQNRFEHIINDYRNRINQVEGEKKDLLISQGPNQQAIFALKQTNIDLNARVQELEDVNSQLRVSNSQIRLLQEQTDKILTDQQHRIMNSESKVGFYETKVHEAEKLLQETIELKGEITGLNSKIMSIEREKDKFLFDLDKKTEKLFEAEGEIQHLQNVKMDLEETNRMLQNKITNINTECIEKDGTLRSASSETESLRKQVAQLKCVTESAHGENRRLVIELSDVTTELTILKAKLRDSQNDVDNLKTQLQQYVSEVQRAENLLLKKEKEREEMLNCYKSLSLDTSKLEESNQSLELATAETKKLLDEASTKIIHLEDMLRLRENQLDIYEKQMNTFNSNAAEIEMELEELRKEKESLMSELESLKELCDKLDQQKDKLKEELAEHSSIRQQLQQENEKLQHELGNPQEKAQIEGLNELLQQTRRDYDAHKLSTSQLNSEVQRLREQCDTLHAQLLQEQENAVRKSAQADKYSKQIQDLKRLISDDKFDEPLPREEFNRNKSFTETKNVQSFDANNSKSLVNETPEHGESYSQQISDCVEAMATLASQYKKTVSAIPRREVYSTSDDSYKYEVRPKFVRQSKSKSKHRIAKHKSSTSQTVLESQLSTNVNFLYKNNTASACKQFQESSSNLDGELQDLSKTTVDSSQLRKLRIKKLMKRYKLKNLSDKCKKRLYITDGNECWRIHHLIDGDLATATTTACDIHNDENIPESDKVSFSQEDKSNASIHYNPRAKISIGDGHHNYQNEYRRIISLKQTEALHGDSEARPSTSRHCPHLTPSGPRWPFTGPLDNTFGFEANESSTSVIDGSLEKEIICLKSKSGGV